MTQRYKTILTTAAVTTGFLVLAVLALTCSPLRRFVPESLDVTRRGEMVRIALRLDSLQREADLHRAYIENLSAVLQGVKTSDELEPIDSTRVKYGDSLLSASPREQLYVERYKHRERFGVGALDGVGQPQYRSWMAPVKGEYADGRLLTPKEVTVLSPLEGTIVNQRYLMGEGWEVTLMAPGDYVVILSHLSMVLQDVGATVRAGSAIGHSGGQKEPADRWLTLNIWYKGEAIDPSDVMTINQ